MKPVTVRIPLTPVPASRPRVPRFGKPYYPQRYAEWRKKSHALDAGPTGPPIEHPVRADVLFAIPRAKTSKLIVPSGDGDNFEKAIYDLLQSTGYLLDDKWITSATWRKTFLPFGEQGYTEVTLYDDEDYGD